MVTSQFSIAFVKIRIIIDTLCAAEGAAQERRFVNRERSFQPAPLEELRFAEADHPWDEAEARSRLKDASGWAGLASYSLLIDPLKDPESFDAYGMLVADVVDGEPKIVPTAVEAAIRSLEGMDAKARESVKDTLDVLRERIARADRGTGNHQDDNTAVKTGGEGAQSGVRETNQHGKSDSAQELVERLSRNGRLLSAWGRETMVEFITGLSDEPTMSANAADKLSPRAYFTRILESLPSLVPMTEFSPPSAPRDGSLEALGRKIATSLKQPARR